MGCDFGQVQEWNHDTGLEWQALTSPRHKGVQRLVRDLNHVYRHEPALYQVDFDWNGFQWIDANDSDNSVFSFIRLSENRQRCIIVVCNFTPVVRTNYHVGVPQSGAYRELINSDLDVYGGSGVSNGPELHTFAEPCHTFAQSLSITLPPLATLILQPCS
jgi:1,4-alpha-glucan branching enzyme